MNQEMNNMTQHTSFFERYQVLHRQKKISNQHHKENSVLIVVKDDSYGVPKKAHGNVTNSRRKSDGDILSPLLSPLNSPVLSPISLVLPNMNNHNTIKLSNQDVRKDSSYALSPVNDRTCSLTNSRCDSLAGSRPSTPIPKRIPGAKLPRIGRSVIAQLSPRSVYINACIRERVNPRQALIGKMHSNEALLQHQGLGDKMCTLLSESISSMDSLNILNLRDNNLTDHSLPTVIDSCITLAKTLITLDLSYNSIGIESATSLNKYLGFTCEVSALRELRLDNCGIDDQKCQIMLSLFKTTTNERSCPAGCVVSRLRTLTLSGNKCGNTEANLLLSSALCNKTDNEINSNNNPNTGVDNDDAISTGVLIANMLADSNCQLETLKLDWNLLKKNSIKVICGALKTNTSLTSLDLSYNALGKDGGVYVGEALMYNNSLESLQLAHNNIDATAAFTITAAVLENQSLVNLNIDGNPIGDLGLEALMLIPLVRQGRLTVSAEQCTGGNSKGVCSSGNTRCDQMSGHGRPTTPHFDAVGSGKSSKQSATQRAKQRMDRFPICSTSTAEVFDFDQVPGQYVLDMTNPYHRAVSIILLHLVAYHYSYKVHSLIHNPGREYNTRASYCNGTERSQLDPHLIHKIDLYAKYVDVTGTLDVQQMQVADKMECMLAASKDIVKAKELFNLVDRDHDNGIDINELDQLMQSLSIQLTNFKLRETMATYDVDGNGSIDCDEFTKFLLHTREDIEHHLWQLKFMPMLVYNKSEYVAGTRISTEDLVNGGLDDNEDCSGHQRWDLGNTTPPSTPTPHSGTLTESSLADRMQSPTCRPIRTTTTTTTRSSTIKVNDINSTIATDHKRKIEVDLESYVTLDDVTYTRFTPPNHGILYIDVINSHIYKDVCLISPSCNLAYTNKLAEKTSEPVYSVLKSLRLSQLRVEDAIYLYNTVVKSRNNRSNSNRVNPVTCAVGSGVNNKYTSTAGASANATNVLVLLLHQMRHVEDARLLVTEVIGDDRVEMSKLRKEMGHALKTSLGLLNGYYSLDMSVELDRKSLITLFDVNNTTNHHKALKSAFGYGLVGDTSQKGNWTSFRNEMWNNQPVIIDSCFMQNLPTSGHVEFDYIGENRPNNINKSTLNDNSFVKILVQLGLVQAKGSETVLGELEEATRHCRKIDNNPGLSLYQGSTADAAAVDHHSTLFYDNLAYRSDLCTKAIKTEMITVCSESSTVVTGTNPHSIRDQRQGSISTTSVYNGKKASTRMASNKVVATCADSVAPITTVAGVSDGADGSSAAEIVSDVMVDTELDSDGLVESRGNTEAIVCTSTTLVANHTGLTTSTADCSKVGTDCINHGNIEELTKGDAYYNTIKHLTNHHSATSFITLSRNSEVNGEAKMKRLLELLEEIFGCYKYIKSRHLAQLLSVIANLDYGNTEKTKYFGNYRVDIIVMLFGHIIDLHNFDLVRLQCTNYEIACINARIGCLNFFNPIQPEGSYCLHLRMWDQRQLAKMLIVLETHEPGENWIKRQFRWTIDSPPIPGWVLTKSWVTEEGLPNRGVLEVTYYSGDGVQNDGCIVHPEFRRSLLYMTTLREEDLYREVDNETTYILTNAVTSLDPNIGWRTMHNMSELWANFLNHDMYTDTKQICAVTAPRKVKHSGGVASIPSMVRTAPVRSRGLAQGSSSLLPLSLLNHKTMPVVNAKNGASPSNHFSTSRMHSSASTNTIKVKKRFRLKH